MLGLAHRDRRARRRVRLAGGDEPAHRRRPDRAARRQQRDRHPLRLPRGAVDHHHRRDDARSRRRHRLRAVHPGPAPAEPRRAACRCRRRSAGPTRPPGCPCCSPASPWSSRSPSLQVAGIPMLTAMGWGSALMVAVTMVAAVTLLPGLLGLVGRKVNSLRVPFVRQRPANDPRDEVRPVGGEGRRPPVRYGARRGRAARRPRHPGVRAADRLRRRRQRGSRQHPAHVLRPDRRRLRPRRSTARSQVAVETDGSPDDAAALARRHRRHSPATRASPRSSRPALSPSRRPGRHRGHAHHRSRRTRRRRQLVHRLRTEVLPDRHARAPRRGHGHRRDGRTRSTSPRGLPQRMLWFVSAVIGLSFLVLHGRVPVGAGAAEGSGCST